MADAAAIAAIHLVIRDARPAELEVWDGNTRAKSFYAARGWRATERTRDGVAGIPYVT